MLAFDTGAIALTGHLPDYSTPVFINDLNCTGNESSIFDCAHNSLTEYTCRSSDDAAVICQGMHGSMIQLPLLTYISQMTPWLLTVRMVMLGW